MKKPKIKLPRKLKKQMKKIVERNTIFHSLAYSFNIPVELLFCNGEEVGKIGSKIGFADIKDKEVYSEPLNF
jgi:hypothetical protein